MLGTYASAALICAASMLVGRAILSLSGRSSWSWLEPGVGFAAILSVTGLLSRADRPRDHGHAWRPGLWSSPPPPSASRRPYETRGALRAGLPVAVAIALALTIPFLVNGRWGLIGVGFNNDLGLHLAWAEWLRSGFGPEPVRRLPARPPRPRRRRRRGPGHRRSARPSSARSSRSGSSPALTALGALAELGPARRTLGGADGRGPLPGRLLLRPGRLQGDRRGALRASPSASRLRDPRRAVIRQLAAAAPRPCHSWRWPAASSSPTASPASPGRSRSSPSGA